jgi:cytochrome c oxidase subunit II
MISFASSLGAWSGPLPGFQSALNPAGPGAQHIADLWIGILIVCIFVFVIIWIVLLSGVARTRHNVQQPPPPLLETEAVDRKARKVVGFAVGATLITLFVILVSSIVTGKKVTEAFVSKNPVTIEVVGHQWWWEIHYPNLADASKTIVTANEIHLPIGVPILLNTASRDVIHSFWAPNVHGKRDLIPGYTNSFWFQVDKAGIYRGQCAEFCGVQHAKMAFFIIAEPLDKFQEWQAQQLAAASTPANELQQHGQQVFLKSTCVMCHTIRGTIAGSRVGPDLTHLASRQSIAAATLPNNPGSLGAWIVDSQHIKPGNYMPPNPLSGDDLTALLAYLENLK